MFFATWSVKGSPESLHRALERRIVEKTSVFRDSEFKIVEKSRDLERQIVEKTSVFRDSELKIVEKRNFCSCF